MWVSRKGLEAIAARVSELEVAKGVLEERTSNQWASIFDLQAKVYTIEREFMGKTITQALGLPRAKGVD